ncbi:MAG: putative membrane protein YdjX (TVP38/TMEM64 family) [Chlamydiales bacterium]|jgi:uncharacterized membrane protein YdjX (TVP38/TMEM64 family)
MLLAYISGIGDFLNLETLKQHRQELISFVESYPLLAPITYILCYIIATALSIPGAILLTLTGGFLFPQPFCTIYTITGASIGACIIFLIARTTLGDSLKQKAGKFMNKMESGLKENAVSYLLFLRFVPIFPFWVANLAPAFFGVSFFTYAWTTVIGITPGSFVFTQAGAGLGAILDSEEKFSVSTILNNDMKIALLALGIFALIPILLKKLQNKNSEND